MAQLKLGTTIGGYQAYHAGNLGNWHLSNNAPTGTTRLNYDGYLYATRVYNAVYNDYAEYFERGCDYIEPGDVIMVDDDGRYVKAIGAYNKRVVGVCSNTYGMCIGGRGDGHDDENFIPVALAGRVSVKVVGKVKLGDLLTTSDIPGVAMKAEAFVPGTIIGKALQAKTDDGIGLVKMLVFNA